MLVIPTGQQSLHVKIHNKPIKPTRLRGSRRSMEHSRTDGTDTLTRFINTDSVVTQGNICVYIYTCNVTWPIRPAACMY